MIKEYHRPKIVRDALALLERKTPRTVPLGGGTTISKTSDDVAVVDLQDLGWNKVEVSNNDYLIGSMTTLESIRRYFGKDSAIGKAIILDAGKNIRDMATIGGSLVASDGRSAFLTILLAHRCTLVWEPGNRSTPVGEWLNQRRPGWNKKELISQLRMEKAESVVFDSIGRSPLDQPILCCSIAKYKVGIVRIALGGFGDTPVLVFEGSPHNIDYTRIKDLLNHSDDAWASNEYRKEAGEALVRRLVNLVTNGKEG